MQFKKVNPVEGGFSSIVQNYRLKNIIQFLSRQRDFYYGTKYFLVIFLVLFNFVVFNNFVNAQGVGIKITPALIEDLVEPGQIISGQLKVTNQSDAPRKMYPFLKDFTVDGEKGNVSLHEPGETSGSFLASWIEIDTGGFDFAPRQERAIPYVIKVPENTGPGGYYGAIVFGPKSEEVNIESEDKGAGMSIVHQVSTLILFQVKGDVYEDAQVREFLTDKESYSTPFEVEFSTKIENLGNVHVKPQGSIIIENMFGKEVENIIFNDKGSNVMPESVRSINSSWEGDMGFGRYKAVLGITYGTSAKNGGAGMKSLHGEKYFWIIPWKIVGPVIGIFLVVVVLFTLFVRIYKNKAIKKAMGKAGVAYKGGSMKNSDSGQFGLAMFTVFIILFFILFSLYFLLFA